MSTRTLRATRKLQDSCAKQQADRSFILSSLDDTSLAACRSRGWKLPKVKGIDCVCGTFGESGTGGNVAHLRCRSHTHNKSHAIPHVRILRIPQTKAAISCTILLRASKFVRTNVRRGPGVLIRRHWRDRRTASSPKSPGSQVLSFRYNQRPSSEPGPINPNRSAVGQCTP